MVVCAVHAEYKVIEWSGLSTWSLHRLVQLKSTANRRQTDHITRKHTITTTPFAVRTPASGEVHRLGVPAKSTTHKTNGVTNNYTAMRVYYRPKPF